eukprot:TCONS_00045978-protein
MEAAPPSYNDVMTGQWQPSHQDEVSHHHASPSAPSAPLMTDDNNYSNRTSKQLEASTSFMTPPNYTAGSSTSAHQVSRDDGSTVAAGVSSSGVRLISVTPSGTDNLSNNQPTPLQEPQDDGNSDSGDSKFTCGPTAMCMFFTMAALPIAMVVLGVVNLDKCPMSPQIPLFMIVSGALWSSFFASMLLSMHCEAVLDDVDEDDNMLYALPGLILVAGFGVQCWGSYLVFSEWNTWTDYPYLADNLSFGCDKTSYLFSFSMLIIFWCLGPCVCCLASVL